MESAESWYPHWYCSDPSAEYLYCSDANPEYSFFASPFDRSEPASIPMQDGYMFGGDFYADSGSQGEYCCVVDDAGGDHSEVGARRAFSGEGAGGARAGKGRIEVDPKESSAAGGLPVKVHSSLERTGSGASDAPSGLFANSPTAMKVGAEAWPWEPGQLFTSPTGSSAGSSSIAPPPGVHGPPAPWAFCEHLNALAALETEGQSIRLVKAVRPPRPLHHNQSTPVTSLTINHVPILMRRTQLCALLDQTGFEGRYNYLYVPCNRDKTNRGHAFVNLHGPDDAKEFFSVWHGARVVGIGSDAPVLIIAVSKVQGYEASVQRWTTTKMCSLEDPDFRPFIEGVSR